MHPDAGCGIGTSRPDAAVCAGIVMNCGTGGGSHMKKYYCVPCGYVYDPAEGDPDGGIAPGTAFEDIPDDWVCPVCGVGKEDFELYEE